MDIFDFDEDTVIAGRSEEQRRLDAEWLTLSAVREAIGVALKGTRSPTYVQALDMCKSLLPALFNENVSILVKRQESLGVQKYRQKAEALSTVEDKEVTPLEAVNRDIAEIERLVAPGNNRDRSLLERDLNELHEIRRAFQPQRYTEQKLILRDMFKTNRLLPVSKEGADYREFSLTDGRVLRIRLLHPDPPEYATGADVIYEHYWDKKKVVRLAAVQYKTWKGKSLSVSQRLRKQLNKLNSTFCDNHLCEVSATSARRDAYRLPYCTAFLRPTDEIQLPNLQLTSSGYHIPICIVQRLQQSTSRGGSRLPSNMFRSEAITHKIFEEMFNTNMLGSRWLTYEELEKLYQEHRILEAGEHIIIHAQEYSYVTDSAPDF